MRHDFPTITEALALSLADIGMNDTVGPEGLLATPFVFGIIPRLSADGSLPNQPKRMLAKISARCEMDTTVSELRVKRGLSSKTPPGECTFVALSYTSTASEVDRPFPYYSNMLHQGATLFGRFVNFLRRRPISTPGRT
jgi:hypothetical protein